MAEITSGVDGTDKEESKAKTKPKQVLIPRRIIWISTVILFIGLVIASYLFSTTNSFNYCIEQQKSDSQYKEIYKKTAGLEIRATVARVGLNAHCLGHAFRIEHDVIEALAAVGGLFFSGVLTLSTVLLWKETKRLALGAETQSRDMRDSIAESARAANAMIASAEAMKDFAEAAKRTASATEMATRTLINSESPIIRVEDVLIPLKQENMSEVEWIKSINPTIKIKNYGRSPAIVDDIIVNLKICRKLPEEVSYQRAGNSKESFPIERNLSYVENCLAMTDAFDPDSLAMYSVPEHHIFIYGKIAFRNFLSIKTECGFAFVFDSKKKSMINLQKTLPNYCYENRIRHWEDYKDNVKQPATCNPVDQS